MIELLKVACVVIIIVCCISICYAIWKAIETIKKNRQAEEMSRQIFLAQLMQSHNQNGTDGQQQSVPTTQMTNQPQEAKELNYDEFENNVDLSQQSNKSLKDFYSEN